MNNLICNLWSKRNSKFDLALIALFFASLVLGCGGGGGSSSEKKPIPPAYLGTWTGQDGSTISIRADGTGDWNQGSSKVNGAAVEVDEAAKEIKFTMLGIDSGKYKIDSPPKGNTMKLNGMTYKRAGGGVDESDSSETESPSNTRSKTTTDSTDTSGGKVPAEAEINSLTGETMEQFNSALQSGDFADFHKNISKAWQKQITPEKLEQSFAQFIEKKIDLTPKTGAKPTYSPKPTIDQNGMLVVNGTYPTAQGGNAQFNLTYIKEGGEWKLAGIRVNVK